MCLDCFGQALSLGSGGQAASFYWRLKLLLLGRLTEVHGVMQAD